MATISRKDPGFRKNPGFLPVLDPISRVAFSDEATNNASGDAFGRLRVSAPFTLFDSQHQYDTQPLLWDTKLAGSGAETHLPNESAVDLSVTTASGDSVIRQTKEYIRYQPGKSQLILCTCVFGEPQTGTNKLVGYGDTNNGIFFGQDGGGSYVLLRSKATGSVSDERKVYQVDWNLDAMDGTGPSLVTFDPTKTQIVVVDLEWLGVGRVRIGLNIDGVTRYVHEFLNANQQTVVYMTTANLPVRYEITNTALVAAAASLKHICTSVISEGGVDSTAAYPFAGNRVAVSIPNGLANEIVVYAIRPSLTFNSIENRSRLIPSGVDITATGGTVVLKAIYNPTITGGTWNSFGASSGVDVNTTATSYTGGITTDVIVALDATKGGTPLFDRGLVDRLPFGIGIDADSPIPLAFVAYATSNSVTASFTVRWEELR